MRTTLDIEDEILQAVKERAEKDGVTTGKLASQMLRKALTMDKPRERTVVNGVPVFPSRGEVITLEHVRKIMEEEGL
jgi:hypothetical protein